MRLLVSVVGPTMDPVACPPHSVTTKYKMWNAHYPRAKGHTHYLNVKDDLHSNDVVILADSDMNFTTFDCPLFFEKWSKYKPLISSPTTIGKDNEFSHYLWKNAGISRDMMKTYWVEQNFAVFDAAFLKYYMNTPLVSNILRLQRRINIAWGLDWTWCGAASEWNSSRLGCAIIDVPVEDMNTKTMGQKNRRFTAAGFDLVYRAGLRRQWCWEPKCCALHKWFYQAPAKHAVTKMNNVSGDWLPNEPYCTFP